MTAISAYKCPNCGADIPYDPGSQNLKCPYCDTEYPIETLAEYNEEINIKDTECNWQTYKYENIELGKYEYTCPSCGGSVVMDEENSTSICPYCGGSIILNEKISGSLKPDLVIPFKHSKTEAINALENEFKNKFLLPHDFKSHKYLDKVEGVYVPYWLFDCDADCSARFKMTKRRVWSDSSYHYTQVSHFLGIRDGELSFNKVPVDASIKLDSALSETLEPFDYDEAVDFNTAYLAGFYADIRQEDEETCKKRANERIQSSMIKALASTVIGYSSCILESSSIIFNDGKIHYALLPVYLLSRTYNDKVYTFAINGQTLKVAGEIPSDIKKLVLYSIFIFVLSFAVIFAIGYLCIRYL